MLSPARELESFKFLDRLSTHLKRAQGSQKALRHVLRDARELLDAWTNWNKDLVPPTWGGPAAKKK